MTHSPIDGSSSNEETGKSVASELPSGERPAPTLPPLPKPDKQVDLDKLPNLPPLPPGGTGEHQSALPPLPKVNAVSDSETADNGENPALPALPSNEVKLSDMGESEDGASEKSELDVSVNENSGEGSPLTERHLRELKQTNPPRMPAIPVLPVLAELSEQSNPSASTEAAPDSEDMKSDEVKKPDKLDMSEIENEDVAVEQALDVQDEKKATVRISVPTPDDASDLPPVEDRQSASTNPDSEIPARVQETDLDIPAANEINVGTSNGDSQPATSGKEIQVELPQQSQAARREPVVDQGFLAYMGSLDDGDRVRLLALPQIIAHWVASVDGQVDIHESLIIHRILKDGAVEIDEEFQNLRWENQAEVNKWIESVMPKELPMALRAQFDVLLMPLDEYQSIFETMPTELRGKFSKCVCDICTEVAEASDNGKGIAGKIGLEEEFVIRLIRESLGIDAPESRINKD